MHLDIFISHASEDKEEVARPLANLLRELGISVWLDEYELTLGDSLRRSIDTGLKNSRFGVIILSPDFFKKEWPQKELDALVAREDGAQKVILPIWHKVDRAAVLDFSVLIADRLAIPTSKGLHAVAAEVYRAVKASSSKPKGLPGEASTKPAEPTSLITNPLAGLGPTTEFGALELASPVPRQGPSDESLDAASLARTGPPFNFVLAFGPTMVGKTALLGSLVDAARRMPDHQVFLKPEGTEASRRGFELVRRLASDLDRGQFPYRTAVGGTSRIAMKVTSPDGLPLKVNFLETSGEDLIRFSDGVHLRKLPPHLDAYLQIPGARFLFLLLVDWNMATQSDLLMADFASYVNRQQPKLFGTNLVPVFTKWDTQVSTNSSAVELFNQQMPRTANLLAPYGRQPIPYSVGTVLTADASPIIVERSFKPAKLLFSQILEYFSPPARKKRFSAWQRFISGASDA
jgi:hypothetical protein